MLSRLRCSRPRFSPGYVPFRRHAWRESSKGPMAKANFPERVFVLPSFPLLEKAVGTRSLPLPVREPRFRSHRECACTHMELPTREPVHRSRRAVRSVDPSNKPRGAAGRQPLSGSPSRPCSLLQLERRLRTGEPMTSLARRLCARCAERPQLSSPGPVGRPRAPIPAAVDKGRLEDRLSRVH
ncbi:hypothetical protein BDY21DRAFT_90839 [Lineolata rhizophorae]|uniref:Uncharacterized protein n=1 Tax=Lineolata rhizophorae TaxID=578093 RepID=A0A6A6PCT8_9PEZI|nr:hypothetical protein BDY21DRAFT_90839 [Lineolata rhizophorae]